MASVESLTDYCGILEGIPVRANLTALRKIIARPSGYFYLSPHCEYVPMIRSPNRPLIVVPDDESSSGWREVMGCLDYSSIGGDNQVIAVIDSGYDDKNSALTRVTLSEKCKDFTDEGILDRHGHGTLVALLIAAIAPEAKQFHVKVFEGTGRCVGKDRDERSQALAEAIHYAIHRGATVINISGGFLRTGTEKDRSFIRDHDWCCTCEICKAAYSATSRNIPVIAAGGNKRKGVVSKGSWYCPSAAPGVVSTLAWKGNKPLYTPALPKQSVGVSGVLPQVPVKAFGISLPRFLRRLVIGGSSFASPLAAGTVACIMQLFSEIPRDDSRVIKGNAYLKDSGHGSSYMFDVSQFFHSFDSMEGPTSEVDIGRRMSMLYQLENYGHRKFEEYQKTTNVATLIHAARLLAFAANWSTVGSWTTAAHQIVLLYNAALVVGELGWRKVALCLVERAKLASARDPEDKLVQKHMGYLREIENRILASFEEEERLLF